MSGGRRGQADPDLSAKSLKEEEVDMIGILKSMAPLALCLVVFVGTLASEDLRDKERAAEERIIGYLRTHLKPGQPVLVTELHQRFTEPEERRVLSRLYNIFFKVPHFVAQYYAAHQRPPRLREIAEQFNLLLEGEVDVILRIVEFDRRVPQFFKRDPESGEIASVDLERIKTDPRFNKVIERSIAGWEGKKAPQFTVQLLDGAELSLDSSRGARLVYFWFTHCPPCVKITPHLVSLQEQFGRQNFTVISLNADRVLDLGYPDSERAAYLAKHRINFPVGHLTAEVQEAYGGIQLFPSLFLVDKDGVIRHHFVNYQDQATLENAIKSVL